MAVPTLTDTVAVDWDNDGGFAQAGDDVSARVRVAAAPLWVERGRNQLEPGSPPVASEMGFALRNESKDYNPLNASSPLFGKLKGAKPIKWETLYSATTYPIGRVLLRSIHPDSDWSRRVADVHGLGQLAQLVGVYGLSSKLYGDGTTAGGIYTGDALAVLFGAAGLSNYSFDQGKTKLLWFRVRPDVEAIVQAIQLWAAEGEGAELFDGKDGVAYFYDRYRKLTNSRMTTVQATFNGSGTEPTYGGPPTYPKFDYDDGDAHVVNACTFDWKQRAADAADAVIWSLGSTATIAPSSSSTFPVAPNVDDAPIYSVVSPVAGTDYTVLSGSVSSITFDRTSGDYVTMTITAGASGASLSGLQVRGKLARVIAQAKLHETTSTTTSRATYGYKPFTFPTVPDIDYLVAQDFCNAVVSQNQIARPTTVITVPLTNDSQAASALPLEISDRIRVVNDPTSFDLNMYVEWLKWERPQDGSVIRAQIGCKKVYDAPYAAWGSAVWGTSVWAF